MLYNGAFSARSINADWLLCQGPPHCNIVLTGLGYVVSTISSASILASFSKAFWRTPARHCWFSKFLMLVVQTAWAWNDKKKLELQCLQLLFEQSPWNWPNFIMLFYYIKVPPHFSPPGPILALTGALKWGTVWTSTSNGTGIMKGQSWSCILINFDLS